MAVQPYNPQETKSDASIIWDSLKPVALEDLDPDDEFAQEIATVECIYPELVILGQHAGSIDIPVTFDSPRRVILVNADGSERGDVTVSHLPLLKLRFILGEECNTISDLPIYFDIESSWLPTRYIWQLRRDIYEYWKDTESQLLYYTIEYISELARDAFSVNTYCGGAPLRLPHTLREELIAYDRLQAKEEFNQKSYSCGICLEVKKGALCHSLYPCDHVFCHDCLRDFYSTCITEGDVASVKCPNATCDLNKKTKSKKPARPNTEELDASQVDIIEKARLLMLPTLPPSELEAIGLDKVMVDRYKDLKNKAFFDADPETQYCPRIWCQGVARSSREKLKEFEPEMFVDMDYLTRKRALLKNPDLVPEPRKSSGEHIRHEVGKLERCTKCDFAFCNICRHGWHGEFKICRISIKPKTEDELATEAYLLKNTTACPTCHANVIKSRGCNHMICKCQTHFCFLCSAYLEIQDPLRHFNIKKSQCYNRLWEMVDGDGQDGPPQPFLIAGEEIDGQEQADILHNAQRAFERLQVQAANLNLGR